MRIGLIFRVLWPGGVQRIAIEEANGLSLLGHEVDLVFIRAADSEIRYDSDVPLHIVNQSTSASRLLGGLFRVVTSHFASERGPEGTVDPDLLLKFEWRRSDYDVVIYGDPHAALFARARRFLRPAPYVVHVHESGFGRSSRLWRLEERMVLSRANALIASSGGTQRILEKSGFGQVYLLHPGLRLRCNGLPFSKRSDQIVSVTMWDRGRKPEALLPIAQMLPHATVIIAGSWTDGAHLLEFRRRVQRMSLERNVIVTGPLKEAELNSIYMSSKVAIRFGYNERGPGMGALEALGHGLPLVINNGIGLSELVMPGVSAAIVDEGDVQGASTVLARLLQDPIEWARLSQGGLALARTLTWSEHVARLERLLRRVTSGHVSAEDVHPN